MKTIAIFILLTIFCFQTKAQSNFDKLKLEMKENLKWFSQDLNYTVYEANNINIDSLAASTEDELANLLKIKESTDLDLKEFPNLHLNVTTTDSLNIRLYSFSNSVGPTGYESVHTVIQWTDTKGTLFSFPVSSKVPGAIGEIYKLKSNNSTLYLLLSNDYFTNIQYVIQFKGNNLILDYPAFANSPQISENRMDVSFNDITQVLTIASYENSDDEEPDVDDIRLLHIGDYADEDPSNQKIIKQLYKQLQNNHSIKLKFDGHKFIY